MQLKVQTPTFPEVIEFNFDEIKQEVTKKASDYMNLVYSEEQIQDAKKDRAALNKFVKALSDERIKIKKECMKPYEDFERKIKELDGIVNAAIQNIDSQVKGYEEKKKQEKKEAIQKFWNETEIALPIPLKLEQIFNQSWLNASVSMKSIQTEIKETLAKIESDLATLHNLPEFSFEAIEEYKTSLNLSKAIQEGQRLADIQRRKQEQEAEQERLRIENAQARARVEAQQKEVVKSIDEIKGSQPIMDEVREWVSFQAYMTEEQALQLKNFFDCRGIEFKQI